MEGLLSHYGRAALLLFYNRMCRYQMLHSGQTIAVLPTTISVASMTKPDSDTKQLLYFADPMCSWCWGFAPVIKSLVERHQKTLPIQIFMGGLRPGTTKAMTREAKDEIRDHWEHVHKKTGQEFNFDFFEREGFIYDTEPACRAVVTARSFHPGIALRLLERIHKAFYLEGRDTTDRDTLVALGGAEGIDVAAFAEKFDSKEAEMVTKIDFEIAKKVGVSCYPTLLAGCEEEGFGLVASGYQPLEKIEGPISDWLKA